MFDFMHVGGDVHKRQEFLREVTARKAQAGFWCACFDEFFELRLVEQFVVDGVVDLIADDEIVVAARCGLQGFFVGFERRDAMLLIGDVLGAYFAGVVKALAAFIKVELVAKERHDVADEYVLADAPIFDELNERHAPTVAECTCHEAEAGAGFAFAVAGVNDHDRIFGLEVLKRHCCSIASRCGWRVGYGKRALRLRDCVEFRQAAYNHLSRHGALGDAL